MKASETHLGKILEGTNQFVVPLFQRPYTWQENRWKVLWSDLVELCEDDVASLATKPHFIGSIVTVPTRSVPEGVTKFLLIDGQQRLTTLQVLLAALRDHARTIPGKLSERLDKSYLVNQFEDGLDHYKLLPTQTNGDRSAFLAVIGGRQADNAESRVAKAYGWFQKKLRSRGCPDPDKLAESILRRLSLVSIVLDHDDNPHLIFESLNYKGEPLTQADLIRNYFLMRVPSTAQERLFEDCWEPMQSRLGDQLSEFVRHYLMKEGFYVKQGEIYRTLKEQTDNQTPAQISSFLNDLNVSAVHYHRLRNPFQEPNPELNKRLRRFDRLEVGVTWPFTLNLYRDYENGLLSAQDFCSNLDVLENFFIRRFICSVPTHGLNKVFPPLYNQAKAHTTLTLLDGVKLVLSQRDYPTDSVFRQALITNRLYGAGERLPKVKLVLESLERSLSGKEQILTESLTVEHVMPQTLSPSWQAYLGEHWREIHETRLHCLGNLSLSGYNSELSNSDYETKRDILITSPVYLTKSVVQFNRWDENSIQQRGEKLAEHAVSLWPYFGPENLASARLNRSGFTGKTPVAVNVLGSRKEVKTWRDVLHFTLDMVRETSPDLFDDIPEQFPRLFSIKPEDFRAPRQLGEGPLYFETNLSAESVVRYCQQIIEAVDHPSYEWSVETR
jgi:uncharacterized protein with ParB-like and HNH nuclease domain